MGGTNSTMYIATEQSSYFGGDVVKGTLNLNIISPLKCDGLYITILGQEKVSFRKGSGKSRRSYSGENTILETRVQLHRFGGQAKPGQYSFPFTFQLPRNLPGSFNASVHRGECEISYCIKGECVTPGMFTANVRHTRIITVNELLRAPVTAASLRSRQFVNLCCCFGQGLAEVNATVSKNSYTAGELASVACEITNESRKNFRSVRVRLIRAITLTVRGRSRTDTETLNQQLYPGVPAGMSLVGPSALQLPVQVPRNALPTVNGRLLQCTYFVQIELVSSSIWISNVKAKVPIRIFAPQPAAPEEYPEPPPGWSPAVYESMNLTVVGPSLDALPPPAYEQAAASGSEKTPLVA
eukprot:m.227427 g.227427  ORF g.227427 m.227427 type:complete len:354 (+) comp11583_c0_seq1:199-1260(+)